MHVFVKVFLIEKKMHHSNNRITAQAKLRHVVKKTKTKK